MSNRKLAKFLIVLDNESLLYFPGSFLTGQVIVELDDDTPVQGLYFHIVGEGIVKMSGNANQQDKENYIDFRMRLLGENTKQSVALSPGVHSFPFKLGLPLGMPSTFLGKHGWVQYFCKAALKEPSGLTHKNQQVFIVMSPIDLNLEPSLLTQPFNCEVQEKVGQGCFSTGMINCRVRLDKGGYVPGESIGLKATINNQSRVAIKKTKAILTETIQYTAKNKVVATEIRELATIEKGKIEPRQISDWDNELLYIPPLPPTNLRGCHLIRIQYDVFFVVILKGLQKDIRLQLPILMATYPLRNPDGTLKRGRNPAHFPSVLPIFRPASEVKY
ncbi:arrestin domain-containing protein 2-like [Varroa jacobsoni]|uniref:Arrestin C-terminal-like domain-containing protein n=1 Tax=Varroa destructor TaxID=109461 RepID=A0A7M7MD17_VARDE|nr:arrestin domain-containing protein 2-like [Varroa destructor]XP_022698852.1 arrestin domain-containing protein 2-like [Varroa jacobsoni]